MIFDMKPLQQCHYQAYVQFLCANLKINNNIKSKRQAYEKN
jgi:hypothetical protein